VANRICHLTKKARPSQLATIAHKVLGGTGITPPRVPEGGAGMYGNVNIDAIGRWVIVVGFQSNGRAGAGMTKFMYFFRRRSTSMREGGKHEYLQQLHSRQLAPPNLYFCSSPSSDQRRRRWQGDFYPQG